MLANFSALMFPSNESMNEQSTQVNLAKVWPGRNRFLFSGRLQCGPVSDVGYNLCLWLTLLAPTTFFFAVPAVYVWNEISPAIVLVIVVLFILTVVLFLASSYLDPGVIPRYEIQVLFGIQDYIRGLFGIPPQPLQSTEKVYLRSDDHRLLVSNTIDNRIFLTDDLIEKDYKYCPTCRIIRPPRASHCSDCDNCVLRFDHHCPFINNCVGQRNYVFFVSFMVSALVLGLMVLFGIILWASKDSNWASPTIIMIVACVVGIPTALFFLVGLGFGSYHIYLACSGKTTREHLTNRPGLANVVSGAPWLQTFSVFKRPPRLFPAMKTTVSIPLWNPDNGEGFTQEMPQLTIDNSV